MEAYLQLQDDQAELTTQIKNALIVLDQKTYTKYSKLNVDDIKQLVVDDKWMTTIELAVKTEMEAISQDLTKRIKELEERYETPLPRLNKETKQLEEKVNTHLKKMGFVWN